jgi:hypothetical protein
MSIALTTPPEASAVALPRATWLTAAGVASLGAGAIHAAAIGVHAEHRPAAIAFTICAALQLGWGGLALLRANRLVALTGVAVNGGAFLGWIWAKTAGIGFIDGLDAAESIQLADGLAAGLALASVAFAAVSFLSPSSNPSWLRTFVPVTAVAVMVLAMTGMASAGTHSHSGSGHDEAGGHHGDTGGGHEHGTEAAAAGAAADGEHQHEEAALPAKPYDPTQPIDLSGVEGVTPEQQAEAENVLAVTLWGLPQWADYRTAEAAGFRSIGDGFTGTEHFVNQAYMDDDIILDPDVPESLVYDTTGGERRLVAAMYMLKRGTPMSEVPKTGGKLMQWHIHNNLCYNDQGRVSGLTLSDGTCPAGLIKPEETPMIHVWLEPHPCGPFAALEGVGAGQIAEGEERLCDAAHGGH